ncbi:hypothetical protein [Stieleria mannarensis]|uniref:hypothetical protein n=1 Tax=Stieleria mannarensis TaxID=2755585 RepID=UPI0015FFCE72|nr:hypothetical protein [Rhodopirellula sp. JC639]
MKPGDTIRVVYQGDAIDRHKTSLQAWVNKKVSENRWKLAEDAPTLLRVKCNEMSEKMSLQSIGLKGLFSDSDDVSVPFIRIHISVENKCGTVHATGLETRPKSMILKPRFGETIDSLLKDATAFKPEMLSRLKLPATIKSVRSAWSEAGETTIADLTIGTAD